MEKEHPRSLGQGWERNWSGLQPLQTFGSWQIVGQESLVFLKRTWTEVAPTVKEKQRRNRL